MVSFRDAAADSIRSALCAVLAFADDGTRLLGRLYRTQSASEYFNIAAPLRADLCNEDPTDTPVPEGPFEGGQCPGVRYDFTYRGTLPSPPTDTGNVTVRRVGPLGISRALQPTDTCGSTPGTYNRWTLTSPGGNAGLWAGCNAGFSVVSVVPVDAEPPGGCGDPPPILPEPGPITRPVNITYNNSDDDIIDIDGDVTFAPFFSVGDFNIRVPFRLDLGGVTFDGTLQISPEFNFEIAPRISFGGGGVPDDPDGLPPPDPTDTEPVEPRENEPLIIGVIVRSSPVGELRSTAIATTGQPTIFAPRVGSCSFAIENGFTVAWTSDIPVKNRDNYIPCPVPSGAVGVSVTPEPGWEVNWTPVRGYPLTTTADLE